MTDNQIPNPGSFKDFSAELTEHGHDFSVGEVHSLYEAVLIKHKGVLAATMGVSSDDLHAGARLEATSPQLEPTS